MTEAMEKGLKKIGVTVSKPVLGILTIIFGVLIMVFKDLLQIIVGIFLIVQGILLLTEYYELQSRRATTQT